MGHAVQGRNPTASLAHWPGYLKHGKFGAEHQQVSIVSRVGSESFSVRVLKNVHFHSSYITYRSCKHLDGKHTVFGKLVGGLDTLANLERVETDNKDRPIEDLYIEKTIVFVDPFAEVDEEVSNFDAFRTSIESHN